MSGRTSAPADCARMIDMTSDLIASWIAAIATFGALIAAVAAGLQAKKLYAIESGRDKEAADGRARLQASRINAWACLRLQQGDVQAFGVIVANSSDEPVYNVKVVVDGFTNKNMSTLTCVPPGQYFVENRLIDKGDRRLDWDYAKPTSEFRDPLRPFSASESKKVLSTSFTDSAGQSWKRDLAGGLSRAKANALQAG
jgi:hypothetical protein